MNTVLMFIFSQCSPFIFSDKFYLKMLLKLSQKIATLVACQIFCFPEWSEFVFWNSGTRITNTRVQNYVREEQSSKKFSEGYRTLICVIINPRLYLKSHYSIDALHWLLQKWNVTSGKYETLNVDYYF